jgi:hypothetical protein
LGLRWLDIGFPPLWSRFDLRPVNVGFLVEKEALGQVFSRYFGSLWDAFHRFLHSYHHASSSVAGTVVYLLAAAIVESAPLTPPPSSHTEWVERRGSDMFLYMRVQGFTAVTMMNTVFCDIETQFILHRRHITSLLHSPDG